MQATAETMAGAAAEATRQSASVAQAAQAASMNVQTVASAGEELSASINEIARQVTESTAITQQAVAETDRTGVAIQTLAEAAKKIGNVVTLINNIAGQTKLLALNATIEAVRAGDAGKGFAVVASEVKSLSDQTAKATHEISSQVSAMQAATAMRDGVELLIDLYRPDGAAGEGDLPVILGWSPYGKHNLRDHLIWPSAGVEAGWISKYTAFEAPDPAYWCPRGYAIAYVDPRRRSAVDEVANNSAIFCSSW